MAFFKITHTIPRNSRECYFLFNSLPQNYAIEERQKKKADGHDTEKAVLCGRSRVGSCACRSSRWGATSWPAQPTRTHDPARAVRAGASAAARSHCRPPGRASAQGTEQTLRPCPCAHAPKAIFNAADGRWKVRSAARARTGPAVDLDHSPFTVRASTRTSRGRPLLFCRRLSSAGSRPADDCVFTAVAARSLRRSRLLSAACRNCRPFRPPKRTPHGRSCNRTLL